MKTKDAMLDAMMKEITDRKDYLTGDAVETIYFGGGTPSLLSIGEIVSLTGAIAKNYTVLNNDTEITLEGNPDDLTFEKLRDLYDSGVNRLSIGIQSFHESDLRWLNRAHSAGQSFNCIENAHKAGFKNISIDLIYGIPGQTDKQWNENMNFVSSLGLPHFSAYALTVEPKTALDHMIHKGKATATDEEQAARHFLMLQEWSLQHDFIPYEISNYCRPGFYSKHNTSYWQGKKYIGIGPSAHSYNLQSRQWNTANNNHYIKRMSLGYDYFEMESLTREQRYNEYIMTSLRTIWGCSKDVIKNTFGQSYLSKFENSIEVFFKDNFVEQKNNIVYLTLAGKLLTDKITMDLFVIDN